MTTRLYFHEALSGLSNLPSTRNSNAPGSFVDTIDSQTVNRSMDRNIGSSFTNKSITTLASTSNLEYYFTKFVSPPLTAQSISSNTWTFNIVAYENNLNANFPVSGSNVANYLNVYLYRPGTGLVGNFINGNTNATWTEPTLTSTFTVQQVTFSGASQTAQLGDVIIVEIVSSTTQSTATARAIAFGYDGTTVNTTAGATSTNNASFLETPQDLVFVGETPIVMTIPNTGNLRRRFITKV